MSLAKDLYPSPGEERKHKKHLAPSPSSYFMDVERPGCCHSGGIPRIGTTFSHAPTTVWCVGCPAVLCQPTGGKARLPEGGSFRRKQH
ncbi:small ribosomal subunit protein eS27-like [Desmodus rotundus]|uniref:small ribosomal subunit protein eS27-like n=1 Tax=Desmodus rotundus TaxID=9430 RepID=UPI0023813342|nr:40S ribosomal protein S27-like [Desmodus rotundus]